MTAKPADAILERKVAQALGAFPVRHRYLVGVSGGRDSVALLHLLHALGYRRLVVCHLDHQLRGRASSDDARFVQRLARKLGYGFEMERADVARAAAAQQLSIENAARNARYEFFGRVAKRTRCRTLLLAHHANDQVETFLLNLFRGTGIAGLGAMRKVGERFGLQVVRPLLGIWREELDAYLRKQKIRFREDHTNQETVHMRNRVRHQILPMLEGQFGREIAKPIWRTCDLLAAEEDWLQSLVPPGGGELQLKPLREAPLALQRRMLQQWLRGHGVPGIGYREVELVRTLLEPNGPAKVNLPGNQFARRRSGRLLIER